MEKKTTLTFVMEKTGIMSKERWKNTKKRKKKS